jgi:Homeodomain-like domain
MAQDVCVVVDAGDRARLAAIAADRNRPQKHAQRARIILLSTDPLSVAEIARLVAVSRPAVWRWQTRYAQAGVGMAYRTTRPAQPASRRGRPRPWPRSWRSFAPNRGARLPYLIGRRPVASTAGRCTR